MVKKKIVVVMGAFLLAGLISQVLFDMEVQKAVTVQAAKKTSTEKTVSPVEIKLPIAIVNLDEGVVQNGNHTNYGADLIQTITEDIKVTGLEDARQGIEEKRYSGYIIIPDQFSANVVTVEAKPTKSQLSFAMAPDVALTERERVLQSAVSIYQTFSNSLSRVYTASLLKEYHQGQDAATDVMERDQVDLERLLEINGYDLVELIQIPELETVERDIKALDLSDNYAASNDGITNINDAYKNFIGTGTQTLGVILGQTAGVEEKKAQTGEDLKAVKEDVGAISISELDDTERTQEEDLTYAQSKESILGQEGVLPAYGALVEDFNAEVLNKSDQYEYTEAGYRQLLEELDGKLGTDGGTDVPDPMGTGTSELLGVKKTYEFYSPGQVQAAADAYALAVEQQYTAKLQAAVDQANRIANGEVDLTTGATMEEILLSMAPGETCEQYVQNQLSGIAFQAGDLQSVETTILKEDVTVPSIMVDGTDVTQLPALNAETVNTQIDHIVQAAKDGRTARNAEYQTAVDTGKADLEDARSKVDRVASSYQSENESHQALLQDLAGFDMLSYINDDEIGGYAKELSANQEDIAEKVLGNNESYETYTGKVYEATNTNITNLQKSISDGQETSNQKLEDTLLAVKRSKESSTEENRIALQNFSSRLSYTRLGELENQTVYDFIVEPLILQNESKPISADQRAAVGEIEKQASDVGVTKPVTDLVKTAKANKGVSFAMVAVISVIILALTILGALKIVQNRKKEQF